MKQKIINLLINNKILLFFICLFFTSCTNSIKEGKTLNVIGKNEQEIISKYGEPNSRAKILISKNVSLYEYQSSLYDLLKSKKDDSLYVIEFNYKERGKNLVIWLKSKNNELIAIDALKWSDDIQF